MNNVTLAHIGGDLVLIGGVAFYFHRKTSALQEEINVLKRENKEMSNAIIELQDSLQQLGSIVMQMQAGRAQSQPQQPVLQKSVNKPAQRQPAQQKQPAPRQQPPKREQFAQDIPLQGMMTMMQGMMPGMMSGMMPGMEMPLNQPLRKSPRVVSDSEDSDATIDDRELDDELVSELQELGDEPFCEGDVCKVPRSD